MKPTVILADDHRLLAEALGSMLRQDYDLVGIVGDGAELVQKVEELQPDVALVDVSMPTLNGIDAARRISRTPSKTRIIFLSMHSDPTYVSEAMHSGASGYVLKRCAVSEVPKAISAALSGQVYVSPLISQEALSAARDDKAVLTARQRQVLQLIAEGNSAKEIAAALNVSVKTAEFHRASIMDRLGLRTTAELTKYAIEHGLTPIA